MTKIQATRYHDLSVGHRVVGHEGKCRHLHGHNYRIHFYCEALEYQLNLDLGESDSNIPKLDSVGRVIDFSVIKEKLCMWLEDNWDHKFLYWNQDPLIIGLESLSVYEQKHLPEEHRDIKKEFHLQFIESLVNVPFNPTAENMADYLLNVIAPQQLAGLGVVCTKVIIEETRKCSVTAEL